MECSQREKRRNEGDDGNQEEAELQGKAFGALRGVDFAAGRGRGGDRVILSLRCAFAGDDGDLFEGDTGFLGDGAGAAQGDRKSTRRK